MPNFKKDTRGFKMKGFSPFTQTEVKKDSTNRETRIPVSGTWLDSQEKLKDWFKWAAEKMSTQVGNLDKEINNKNNKNKKK